MYFVLINEKEESSKVSSTVSDNKPGYVGKLPFKPLPLKEGKKKRRRRSKRREETVSSPKHVAPIIVFADESELDDVPLPVTYSSDHDWEKHTTFDIENLLGTNLLYLNTNPPLADFSALICVHVIPVVCTACSYCLGSSDNMTHRNFRPSIVLPYMGRMRIADSPLTVICSSPSR
jgi:hypothetical protein